MNVSGAGGGRRTKLLTWKHQCMKFPRIYGLLKDELRANHVNFHNPCCTRRVVCDFHAVVAAPWSERLLHAFLQGGAEEANEELFKSSPQSFDVHQTISRHLSHNHQSPQTITKVLPWMSRCNCIQAPRLRQECFRFPLSLSRRICKSTREGSWQALASLITSSRCGKDALCLHLSVPIWRTNKYFSL